MNVYLFTFIYLNVQKDIKYRRTEKKRIIKTNKYFQDNYKMFEINLFKLWFRQLKEVGGTVMKML